jgi:hypothetical protein
MEVVFTNHARLRLKERFPMADPMKLYLSLKKGPTKYQKRYMRENYPSSHQNGKPARGGHKYVRKTNNNICMVLVSRPGKTTVITVFRLPSTVECKRMYTK